MAGAELLDHRPSGPAAFPTDSKFLASWRGSQFGRKPPAWIFSTPPLFAYVGYRAKEVFLSSRRVAPKRRPARAEEAATSTPAAGTARRSARPCASARPRSSEARRITLRVRRLGICTSASSKAALAPRRRPRSSRAPRSLAIGGTKNAREASPASRRGSAPK
jgi:hypothetical protein